MNESFSNIPLKKELGLLDRIEWTKDQKMLLNVLCIDAINKWDWNKQRIQLVQELIEFALALMHYSDGKLPLDEVIGEFVDVDIMMNQFKIRHSSEETRLTWLRQRRAKINHLRGIVDE